MEYNKTLNLPQTEFPMRGSLPQREPEILKKWEEMNIYDKVQNANQGKPTFILHDGPPYANGHIHLGHTLNKVLKDIVVKFHSMVGYNSPYVPGWDTHGLPIELQAIKAMGINRHEADLVEFRRHCKEYAEKFVEIQKEEFKRLGVRGDWDNPYLTLHPQFEADQIKVFGEMAKQGYIYKGLKPVYWCPHCETALAEAEIEYAEKRSASIYVKFPIFDSQGLFDAENTSVVIWTTTPWTLPANLAISLHPEYEYVLAEVEGGERFIVAKGLLENFMQTIKQESFRVEAEYKGEELEGIVCNHPLFKRTSILILGEHVTLEQGTGCVHTAPGHGQEDFEVGKKYNIGVLSPVDNKGVFTAEGEQFKGLFIDDANKVITNELKESDKLLSLGFINHQYPHCWRCKNPVMFRATEQWFASIDGFRQLALEEIDKVKWIPNWGRDRIYNMVADRGDWCISRQRTWGVPIPIFYCADCNKEIINDETISHISNLFREHGSDIWFAKTADELVPSGLKCECGHERFRKETDIMDVWFDSGSSHAAVLNNYEGLSWPADLYLEGSDQHRGWFNSSLSTSVATNGQAPYKAVLTHGFVVDEQGRKMSKSLGNVVNPLDVIEQMGADILRLWVASADYRTDIAVSPNILKQISESYRKIRNTLRYLLGNMYDFDPTKDVVSYDQLLELDKWAILKLHKLIKKVTEAYKNYEYHTIYHAIHNFCAVDMSAVYLDIIKDRVYTAKPESVQRRAAQTVMYEIVYALVRMLTPILAFTTEEVWQYLPHAKDVPSVQLAGWPEAKEGYMNAELEAKWDKILDIREVVTKPLEEARRAKLIGHSLNASVHLFAQGETYNFLKAVEEDLATIFIVSKVVLHPNEAIASENSYRDEDLEGLAVSVEQAQGEKCERCWIYSETVGKDAEHPSICQRCANELK